MREEICRDTHLSINLEIPPVTLLLTFLKYCLGYIQEGSSSLALLHDGNPEMTTGSPVAGLPLYHETGEGPKTWGSGAAHKGGGSDTRALHHS